MPKYSICGRKYFIDVKASEDKADTLILPPIGNLTHSVEICDKIFPLKQLITI